LTWRDEPKRAAYATTDRVVDATGFASVSCVCGRRKLVTNLIFSGSRRVQ